MFEGRSSATSTSSGNRWALAELPEDLAEAIAFLTSPASEFVTGQTFVLGGGVMT